MDCVSDANLSAVCGFHAVNFVLGPSYMAIIGLLEG